MFLWKILVLPSKIVYQNIKEAPFWPRKGIFMMLVLLRSNLCGSHLLVFSVFLENLYANIEKLSSRVFICYSGLCCTSFFYPVTNRIFDLWWFSVKYQFTNLTYASSDWKRAREHLAKNFLKNGNLELFLGGFDRRLVSIWLKTSEKVLIYKILEFSTNECNYQNILKV